MTLIKRALALAGYTDLTYTDKYITRVQKLQQLLSISHGCVLVYSDRKIDVCTLVFGQQSSPAVKPLKLSCDRQLLTDKFYSCFQSKLGLVRF